jgi:hypothetical protein
LTRRGVFFNHPLLGVVVQSLAVAPVLEEVLDEHAQQGR